MSRLNRNRVCGKDNCAGEQATLVIDRGKQNQRLTVTFTDNGVFHKMVKIDRGTKSLRMRIEGPKRLDSGPFQRVDLTRKGGDPCFASRDYNGC